MKLLPSLAHELHSPTSIFTPPHELRLSSQGAQRNSVIRSMADKPVAEKREIP